jgi:hypothetical protein
MTDIAKDDRYCKGLLLSFLIEGSLLGVPGAGLANVRPWHCQVALALTQTAFCIGSVYLKSSLRKVDSANGHVFHPIIYAFLREATAGPIMCALAWFSTGEGALFVLGMRIHAMQLY